MVDGLVNESWDSFFILMPIFVLPPKEEMDTII